MKITAHTSSLIDAINFVSKSIQGRSYIPDLSCLFFTAKSGELTVRGGGLEVQSTCQFDGIYYSDCEFMVDYKLFTATIAAITPQQVVMEHEGSHLTVYALSGVYKFETNDVADYPLLNPFVGEAVEFMLPLRGADFQKAANSAAVCASRDEHMAAINAVKFDYSDGNLVAYGTDRITMAKCRVSAPSTTRDPFSLLLPLSAIKSLARLERDALLTIRANSKYLSATDGVRTVYATAVDLKYPDVESVLAASDDMDAHSVFDINAEHLSAAADIINGFTCGTDLVSLELGSADGALVVSSVTGLKSKQSVQVTSQIGAAVKLYVNAKKLSLALSNHKGAVKVRIYGPNKPIVVCSLEFDYTTLLMPSAAP